MIVVVAAGGLAGPLRATPRLPTLRCRPRGRLAGHRSRRADVDRSPLGTDSSCNSPSLPPGFLEEGEKVFRARRAFAHRGNRAVDKLSEFAHVPLAQSRRPRDSDDAPRPQTEEQGSWVSPGALSVGAERVEGHF